MDIHITEASESQSLLLLTKVIECVQVDKEEQKKLIDFLTEKNKNCEEEKSMYVQKNTDLQNRYDSLEGEKKTLSDDYTDLQNRYDTLEGEKKTLSDQYTDLKSRYDTLEEEKMTKANDYTELSKLYDDLDTENKNKIEELNAVIYEEKLNKIKNAITLVSNMIDGTKFYNLDIAWCKHLLEMKSDIDQFLSDNDTLDDIILKIVSKNGWLAKLATIQWWSKSETIKEKLPQSVGLGSGFQISINNLLETLKEFDIHTSIPDSDFSITLENYKVDYDGTPIINELFPDFKPERFVLCEINYISYNNNVGKCVGYGG